MGRYSVIYLIGPRPESDGDDHWKPIFTVRRMADEEMSALFEGSSPTRGAVLMHRSGN